MLNEHASVLNVLRLSRAPCLTFLHTLMDLGLGSIRLVGFLRHIPRMDMGNFQLFGLLVLSCFRT